MFGEGAAWDSGSQRISEAECLTPAGDGGGERQAPQAPRAGCRLGKCYREPEALLGGPSEDVSWEVSSAGGYGGHTGGSRQKAWPPWAGELLLGVTRAGTRFSRQGGREGREKGAAAK